MFSFSPAGQTRIFRVSPPSRSVGGEVRKCLEEGFDLGFYGEFVQETKSQTLDGPSLDIFGSLKNFVADLFLTSFLTISSSCHLCPSVHYVCSWGGGSVEWGWYICPKLLLTIGFMKAWRDLKALGLADSAMNESIDGAWQPSCLSVDLWVSALAQ